MQINTLSYVNLTDLLSEESENFTANFDATKPEQVEGCMDFISVPETTNILRDMEDNGPDNTGPNAMPEELYQASLNRVRRKLTSLPLGCLVNLNQ